MVNFLEQLVAEWYEFRGYFVRRNMRVGPRPNGGHEGELDVVAFHPERRHLVHVEPSMDADSWDVRERRFSRKFESGRRHIPSLFPGLDLPGEIDQIALLVFGSAQGRSVLGGGRLVLVSDLMTEIRQKLKGLRVDNAAVPEQFQLLRALQFAANYWK